MSTVGSLRRLLARTAADLIRANPDDAAVAVEMGLVDRRWLDQPGQHPFSTAAPAEILERFLERVVERHPSRLSTLGLTAVQLLSSADLGPTGDQRKLAVVFTDLEGFTAYTDEHGDQAAVALIADHHKMAGPIVRRWGGRIVKTIGDGLRAQAPGFSHGVERVRGGAPTVTPPA